MEAECGSCIFTFEKQPDKNVIYYAFLFKVADNVEEDSVNTDVKFQVSALTLILSKKRYPIAKVKAFGLFTHIDMHDGNFAAEGKLSSVSVTDLSPHGNLYREK